MAFLIASPWNSISLTIVMASLIGVNWTIVFIVLSMIIAVTTGLIFDSLVSKKVLPENPNKISLDYSFSLKSYVCSLRISRPSSFKSIINFFVSGLKESKMVVKWLLFGILIAALIRAFVSLELFSSLFSPTALGLGATILFSTIMEVCSEG